MAIQKILTDLEVSGAVTIDSDTDTILKLNSTDNGALYVNYARSDDRHAYVGFGGASDNFTIMSEEVGGQLILGTAATTRMTIDETGNVGVGTDPQSKFHVRSSSSGASTHAGTLIVEAGSAPSIQILSANTQTQSIKFGDAEDGDVGRITYSHATNEMTLVTAAATRMTIDSVGHVGINETNPSEELHVTGRAIITDRLGIGGDFVPQKALHLKNAAPIFRMEDTDTASYAEFVKTSSRFTIRLDPTDTETASEITLELDGTERFVVKPDGVGVGVTNPKSALDVNGGVKVANDPATTALDTKVGTIRYRVLNSISYMEMCMQTDGSTYEWVIIVKNDWTL